MVVAQAARRAGIGILIGGGASLAGSRALASQLYGVAPTDPLTLMVTAGLLAIVARAAALLPA